MKKFNTLFQCKVCREYIPLSFKKPAAVGCAVLYKECGRCKTDYMLKIKITPGTNRECIDLEAHYIKPNEQVAIVNGAME